MIDNLDKGRYDVIESKSRRINRNIYQNEVIAIDLHTYKRIKIEFETYQDKFCIESKSLSCPSVWGYFPENKNYVCTLKQNINFKMDDNGRLFIITELDE